MKKEIALKLAAALESGDYKQGRSRLRDGDSFCCLGVLCNLHAQEHPEVAAKEHDPETYLGSMYCLPRDVVEWAGMRSDNGVPKLEAGKSRRTVEGVYHSLAGANDNGISFAALAAYIRVNYEVL